MSAYNLQDYMERSFQYKMLNKIHGQPNIEYILTIYCEIEPNAQYM